jgi:threonine synthase
VDARERPRAARRSEALTPRLVCVRCGADAPVGPAFLGCLACATDPPAALDVVYDYAAVAAAGTLKAWASRAGGLWRFRELLPPPADASLVTLAEGATPLVRLEGTGAHRVWLKDETRNPTGSFKDRLHAVSLTMARVLGFAKAVASTTGNHGTALAAYAARAGMQALVFCDPRAPVVQRRLMQLFGARVVVLADRGAHVAWLVRERGWYPSTGMTPEPVGAPYGVEGYKTIAYEVFFQLGARFPGRVLVPTSGGDAIYGPWKGFRELRALGAAGALPRMVAVQAAGCDPIVRGWRAGAATVPVHPDPRTIAVSIADETGGPASLRAVAESSGAAEAVSDEAILDAMRRLARQGIAVEPSSAAPVAAALDLLARGELDAAEDVVCVLTGAGAKWPDALVDALTPRELADASPAAVRAWIEALDPASPAGSG